MTSGTQRFLVLLRELPGQPCQPVCTRLAGCSGFGIRREVLLTWWCATCWQMVDTGKLEVGFSPDVLRQIAEAEAARGGKTGESAEKAVGEISRQMVCLPCSMSLCREARPWQVVILAPTGRSLPGCPNGDGVSVWPVQAKIAESAQRLAENVDDKQSALLSCPS